MILKSIKYQENGDMESVWIIPDEQYQMLINYAVNSLMQKGILKVVEQGEDEFLKSGTDEERSKFLEYLETTSTKKMFQA